MSVHGNTQNSEIAFRNWYTVIKENKQWQLETIQSGQPDGFGTYRWSYDRQSYLPVARAMEKIQSVGYKKIACGGFSAGCDMLLRTLVFTPLRCDLLILQSPWIPILDESSLELVNAIKEKQIKVYILCGGSDTDCIPYTHQLYEELEQEGISVYLHIQDNLRHQFPIQCEYWKDIL